MVLGLIPARGGSQRLPRKNLRMVGPLSLLEWAIHSAQKAATLDHLVVSSEDEEIGRAAQMAGVQWLLRPLTYATAHAPMVGVLQHAVEVLTPKYGIDVIVTLQPTTPFRTGALIDAAVEALTETADSVVTIYNGHPTGEVYVSRRDLVDRGRMLSSRCVEIVRKEPVINIDGEWDLVLAERYYDAHLRHC